MSAKEQKAEDILRQNGDRPVSAAKSEYFLPARMPDSSPANAVLDDQSLQQGLNSIHPRFGDLCTRVAGEVWGAPLIDQATKALVTIAIDVVNQGLNGPGSPFEAHVRMALKQGVSYEQIEELLLFTCVYAGFNKAAAGFGKLAEIKKLIASE
jgi:4-carboxymuconolactone decarboxylase